MPLRRWPRRRGTSPAFRRAALCVLIIMLTALAGSLSGTLRRMVTDYAVSAARDEVVKKVNAIVQDVMADPDFVGKSLVDLERDESGAVTAIAANAAAINALSAEVLSRAVEATEQEAIRIEIPVMNLLGSALFMNHGPSVGVDVTMLSSSTAGFRSELTAAGINQTRHQIFLELDVQLSFLMPWRGMETSVQTEILVSETVIVGQVPGSYMNWER